MQKRVVGTRSVSALYPCSGRFNRLPGLPPQRTLSALCDVLIRHDFPILSYQLLLLCAREATNSGLPQRRWTRGTIWAVSVSRFSIIWPNSTTYQTLRTQETLHY